MANAQPETLSMSVPSGTNRPLEYADPTGRRQSPADRVDTPPGLRQPAIA